MIQIEPLLVNAPASTSPAAVARSLALLGGSDPTDRNRFDPGHFTASGFVVSPDGSSLLLIHHRRLDRWLQPGGHIDPGDPSPIAAAAREVYEETGVETSPIESGLIDLDIHSIPARDPEPDHEHFDLRFAFRALTSELVEDDEVYDAAWVRWEDLESYDVDESVLRATDALRRACS
jgi:8-oxo-dGTP pyrophosphatase MutT (NUDIX family)